MAIDAHWLTDASDFGMLDGHTFLTAGSAGTVGYDPITQDYTVGLEDSDDTQTVVLWKRCQGDVNVHARVDAYDAAPGASWGLIMRAGLEHDAPEVCLVRDSDGAQLRVRRDAGAAHETVHHRGGDEDVLQLERHGARFTMRVARGGETFDTPASVEVRLDGPVYVGLFVSARARTHVSFGNVRVVVPADASHSNQTNPLGSHLEVWGAATGTSQIIYSSSTPFEAPNWTPDGRALIYNSQGHLYHFDLATGTPTVIDTGFAVRSNNDHVLSFDGTMLGISDHTEEGHSIVYVVPVEGGTPRRVTALGPSYLHGWSPDGRYLVYTGARDDEYDIYRIGVEGGDETRLTTAIGLDDGSEYTPDGRYIFFNSVRSGTMQLWRMGADGSDQKQMTDDEFNNWFPHVSPDGKEIVFISYLSDVAPSAHPPYKQVYLRRMSVEGGRARVVAYLYGGQGTINVPSWSPDGTHFAFVSNTRMD